MDKSKTLDFQEAVNIYYKMKSQYENNISKIKRSILEAPDKSVKEKRGMFQKKKIKCLNCKRPVGTNFMTTVTNGSRILVAVCGDRTDPCPLKIRLNMGRVVLIPDNINKIKKEMDIYKRQVIMEKNDLIFGYINDNVAIELFEKLNNRITQLTAEYRLFVEEYMDTVDNEEKKKELEENQKLFYNNVLSFKDIIRKYEESTNSQLVNDALVLYTDSLVPLSSDIRKLLYSYVDVEYDQVTKVYRMITVSNEIEEFEYNLGVSENSDSIESFVVGMKKQARNQTLKRGNLNDLTQLNQSSKKTRKRRKLVLIENEEEDGGEEADEDRKQEEELQRNKNVLDIVKNNSNMMTREENKTANINNDYIDSDDEEIKQLEQQEQPMNTPITFIRDETKIEDNNTGDDDNDDKDKYKVQLVDDTSSKKSSSDVSDLGIIPPEELPSIGNRVQNDSSSSDMMVKPPPPKEPYSTDSSESV